jgi:tRNA G46 methylase TrmB
MKPASFIYDLPSILERIELARLFPSAQPLEVELGSGDGSFLAEYARQNPARNFIGVERLLGRIRKMDRKARRAGLSNLRECGSNPPIFSNACSRSTRLPRCTFISPTPGRNASTGGIA